MSPAQVYYRLLCIARTNGPPDPCIFSSEMTAVAPALFKEDGSIRISQKSQLAKHIVGKDPNITRKQYNNSAGRVYDGCALIHRLAWPKVGTISSVYESFVGYVLASAAPDVQVCVVFDCYDQQTTKAPEQKRRRLKTGSYPDVVLEDNTSVPGNTEAFLGNMANKQHLICMLSAHLEHGGIMVIHASEERDADVIIVRKAPASSEMLRKIRCSCKSTNRLCTSCTCFKIRLPCSMFCKCRGQCENGGSVPDGCD